MKTLETGSDKIQKICDKLRVETLEPAKQEALQIIEEARAKADEIIADARREANEVLADTKRQIEQEKNVFKSALEQAGKQSIESLRQSIEKDLFNDQLTTEIEKKSSEPQVIAKILNALIQSIERDGVSADFAAVLPQTVSKEDVARSLASNVAEKLKQHPMTVSDFRGGVQVKLIDRKMTVDISNETLNELIMRYVRHDFHSLLFSRNGE